MVSVIFNHFAALPKQNTQTPQFPHIINLSTLLIEQSYLHVIEQLSLVSAEIIEL